MNPNANYGTVGKGNLKLLLSPRIHEGLEKDYALMAAMFFTEIPGWEQILKAIKDFEREFNA